MAFSSRYKPRAGRRRAILSAGKEPCHPPFAAARGLSPSPIRPLGIDDDQILVAPEGTAGVTQQNLKLVALSSIQEEPEALFARGFSHARPHGARFAACAADDAGV